MIYCSSLTEMPTLNSIMFLLILLELNQKKTLILPLNSIMFLLIPAVTKNDGYDNGFFKFHYVSINSYWNHLHQFDPLMSLNSIMFLLILVAVWYGIVTINTLNSIMFLLILLYNLCVQVSLRPLNSIMFLLIRIRKSHWRLIKYALNSIMFLLIPRNTQKKNLGM